MRIDHIGIQTTTAADTVQFAVDVLKGRETWTLEEFSATTLSRVPGIVSLTEVEIGEAKLHVMQVEGPVPKPQASPPLQHVCFEVDTREDLFAIRRRYEAVRASDAFAPSALPISTEVETDDRGVSGFYFVDPNGIEFEVTHASDLPS